MQSVEVLNVMFMVFELVDEEINCCQIYGFEYMSFPLSAEHLLFESKSIRSQWQISY